ncbi:MAG: HXXEE domain-containing protein [Anaerolineae bacterium]|nr:HXXEE domain-containing protein [Anaerolineae bacterium]
MNHILTVFEHLNFLSMLWLFLIAFVIHEVEEWNITDFERRNFVGVPATVTKKNARMWIGIVCVVGFAWCTAATLSGNPTVAAYVFLPAIALALGNALQHIFWTFYFRQYAPGLVTAVLLLIPLGGYVFIRAVQQGYAPLWYVAILAGLIALLLVHTVRAGNEMTPPIRAIYTLGNWLAEKL